MRRHFEELVATYQDRVYSLARYTLGDADEAHDVTQTVLLRFWRHFETLDSEAVWPWLIRVTRNASIDVVRKRKTYRNVIASDPEGHAMNYVASRAPDPHANSETADFKLHLERALQQVSEPHRTILVLREIEGLKYEEISKALELPLNTVRVYLHRGRRKLREHLEEYTRNDV